jgi:hypothetical protein
LGFFDFVVAGLHTGFAEIIAKRFPDELSSRKSGQSHRGRSSYFEPVFARSKRKGPRQLPARAVSGVVLGETL